MSKTIKLVNAKINLLFPYVLVIFVVFSLALLYGSLTFGFNHYNYVSILSFSVKIPTYSLTLAVCIFLIPTLCLIMLFKCDTKLVLSMGIGCRTNSMANILFGIVISVLFFLLLVSMSFIKKFMITSNFVYYFGSLASIKNSSAILGEACVASFCFVAVYYAALSLKEALKKSFVKLFLLLIIYASITLFLWSTTFIQNNNFVFFLYSNLGLTIFFACTSIISCLCYNYVACSGVVKR